uniref:Ribosomal protein S11 n=1 Tax=Paravannella minima TaxID=1443144 RepID=A0A411K7L7_9EUKA|nr:hypothetical protein [Paravannella minima]QBC73437.1 hypothetical protein [Paravannella minima]
MIKVSSIDNIDLKEDKNYGYIVIRYTSGNFFVTALSMENEILLTRSIGCMNLYSKKWELKSSEVCRSFGLYFCICLKEKGLLNNFFYFIKLKSDFKGKNSKASSLIRGFFEGELNMVGFLDSRPFSHNGVRSKKKRRR